MSQDSLKWSDKLVFELPDIDSEHKALFNHLNDVIELKDMEVGADIAVQVSLEFLVKYVNHHFKAEEEIFDQTDYPLKEEHKRMHEALKKTVMDFKSRIDQGDLSALNDFIPVAKDWLTNHIDKVDRGYVEYCQSAGIGTKSRLDS